MFFHQKKARMLCSSRILLIFFFLLVCLCVYKRMFVCAFVYHILRSTWCDWRMIKLFCVVSQPINLIFSMSMSLLWLTKWSENWNTLFYLDSIQRYIQELFVLKASYETRLIILRIGGSMNTPEYALDLIDSNWLDLVYILTVLAPL